MQALPIVRNALARTRAEGATGMTDLPKRLRRLYVQDGTNYVQEAADEIERLTRERDEARAELERERMRLAACGVVAMSNTPESAAKARDMLPDYRSASCDDVARAVVREMTLRAERDAMAKDAARYRWLRGDSCPDHSRRWTLWEIRHWRAPFWTSDLRYGDLDAAIDAAMGATRPAEE